MVSDNKSYKFSGKISVYLKDFNTVKIILYNNVMCFITIRFFGGVCIRLFKHLSINVFIFGDFITFYYLTSNVQNACDFI